MQAFIVLASLAIAIGAVVWIVIVVRKYQARKAFEREREAQFMAEMLRAKPDLARAPPAPAPAAAVEAAPLPSDPLAAAAASIRDALAAGRAADAAKAFLGIVAERTRLTLEPPVWEGLGRALLAQGAFLEAAWALHAGAALAGDLPGAQKRLVEVASKAGDAGQPQHAVKLYQTLLAKYPQSAYADFVRASIKEQEKKLKG
jgi:predicted Zn-dependent protease